MILCREILAGQGHWSEGVDQGAESLREAKMGLESQKSEWPYQQPDRLHLGILLVLNVGNWLMLCLGLIRHWHAMPSHSHFWGIYLAVIFPLLWNTMRKEKCGLGSLMIMTFAFAGVAISFPLCF